MFLYLFQGNSSETQNHLNKLFQALESFCHPSNSSRHAVRQLTVTRSLYCVMCSLCQDCTHPDHQMTVSCLSDCFKYPASAA